MDPQMHELDRRRFLKWASAAGAFFAAHGFAAAGPDKESLKRKPWRKWNTSVVGVGRSKLSARSP